MELLYLANLLNNLCFKTIITYDCHSIVTNALIPRLKEIKQFDLLHSVIQQEISYEKHLGIKNNFIDFITDSVIIAPDLGASKKAIEIANYFNYPIAIASKTRDLISGQITSIKIDASGERAFIFDDICDGGRTFIELAKALKSQGFEKIYLYVTHGIFSQGLDVFDGLIDHIFTTNTFKEQDAHPLLTAFKLIS